MTEVTLSLSGKAKRMVPSMVDAKEQGSSGHCHDSHSGHHRCACLTLRDLGMLHREPLPEKSTRPKNKSTQHNNAKLSSTRAKSGSPSNDKDCQTSKQAKSEHEHVHDGRCACHTLKELGMVWNEPKPNHTGSRSKTVVTAEMHSALHKKVGMGDLAGEIASEMKREVQLGKESVHMVFGSDPAYRPLEDTVDALQNCPHLQKAVSDRKHRAPGTSIAPNVPRYVPLPSSSNTEKNHDDMDLDLTDVKIPVTPEHSGNPDSQNPAASLHHHHHIQAESDNDKNHLKSVKDLGNKSAKKTKQSSTPRKQKTPKQRRSVRQRAARRLRRLTVPRSYHKLREEDVDEDVLSLERSFVAEKQRRKLLHKVCFSVCERVCVCACASSRV